MNVLKSCRCGHHSLISLQLCSYKLILPTPPNLAEKSFLLIFFSAGQYLRYLLELLNGTLQQAARQCWSHSLRWYQIKLWKWLRWKYIWLWGCGIVGGQKEQYVECGCVALRSLRPLIELWPKLWKLIHQPSRRERTPPSLGMSTNMGLFIHHSIRQTTYLRLSRVHGL